MAGDGGIFIVDTSTRARTSPRLVRAVSWDQCVSKIAITRDGSRIAALDSAAGTITVHEMADASVISQCHDDGALWSVAFTPDGASLVTTGNDGNVKGWNATTGERLGRYDFDYFPRFSQDQGPPGRGSVDAIVSSDGEWVISGGENERVYLWSMREGSEGRPLDALGAYGWSSGLIWRVAVAPDRSWVAGSAGHKIYVWNTVSRELITTLDAQGDVAALGVTADGSRLASGDSSGTILVWECRTFTLQARLEGHGGVNSLGFSPDGQLLYSGGGGEARAWELSKATTTGSPGGSTTVQRVLASPGGMWAAVAVEGGDVHIRDVATGAARATLTGHSHRVRNIAVAPDGTWLATEAGGTIFIWDTVSWAPLTRSFYVGKITGEVSAILASADSRRLFTVDHVAVRGWDLRSGKLLITMAGCLEEAEAVTFSLDGSWLAAGDYYGTIWVWNAENGKFHCTMGGGYYLGRMRALAAAPENTLLACPAGGPIQTWDIQKGEIVSSAPFHRCHASTQVAISPDGRSVMTCREGIRGDDKVTCYDLDWSQDRVARFDDHDIGRTRAAVAFSGDGQWFAFGGYYFAEVRDRATHSVYAEVGGRPDHLFGTGGGPIALSFRGDRLASAGGRCVAICDVTRSEVIHRFSLEKPNIGGCVYDVCALAFSPDGRRLGIAAGDQITILDIASGGKRELTGNIGTGLSAAISSNGQYVVIVGSEGLRVSDARSGHAMAVLPSRGLALGPVVAPDDRWFALAGYHTVEVFTLPQAEHWKSLVVPQTDRDDLIREIVATANDRIIARTNAGNLLMIDLESDHASVSADVGWNTVDTMVTSPNGKWLATGGQDLSVRRLPELSLVATHGMNRRVKSLAWSPDSNSIIAGGDGGVYFLLFENQPP
jgi:WD40 repeat protein